MSPFILSGKLPTGDWSSSFTGRTHFCSHFSRKNSLLWLFSLVSHMPASPGSRKIFDPTTSCPLCSPTGKTTGWLGVCTHYILSLAQRITYWVTALYRWRVEFFPLELPGPFFPHSRQRRKWDFICIARVGQQMHPLFFQVITANEMAYDNDELRTNFWHMAE